MNGDRSSKNHLGLAGGELPDIVSTLSGVVGALVITGKPETAVLMEGRLREIETTIDSVRRRLGSVV